MNHKQKLGYMALGAGILAVGIIIGQIITPDIEAQSNGVFDKITCREIEVIDKHGETQVRVRSGFFGGLVTVRGKEGKGVAELSVGEYGGTVWLEGSNGEPSAAIRSTDHGGEVLVSNLSGHKRVVMYVYDDRGFVDVKGLWPTVFARMSVDENGNGIINTWDRNGNRQREED